jgi:DNA-binding MarR family transcriptional regulator
MSPANSDQIATPRRLGPSRELRESSSFLLKRMGFALKERALAAYEPTGLTPYDHGVLSLLEEDPRETQAQIADALGYDRSHLVGVLDDLEARGLIERRRDPADRRRHLVSLTAEGKQAVAKLRVVARKVDDEFFAALDAEERTQLRALLTRIAASHDPRYAD